MKVICCYSSAVHPLTRSALTEYVPDIEYVETKGLFGYGEAIASRWTGKDDLVVIEQDKGIAAKDIPSFQSCDQPWCTFACETLPEPYTKITTNSLACARFSVRLQQLVSPDKFLCRDPDWMPCRRCNSQGCWNQLDARMVMAFMSHGINHHVHGKVLHYHAYDQAWWHEWGKDWDYIMDTSTRLQEIRQRNERDLNYA